MARHAPLSHQDEGGGRIKRLILNLVQAVLPKYLDVYDLHLVLKARQQGISTFLAWHLDATLFTPNCNTFVLADSRETSGSPSK